MESEALAGGNKQGGPVLPAASDPSVPPNVLELTEMLNEPWFATWVFSEPATPGSPAYFFAQLVMSVPAVFPGSPFLHAIRSAFSLVVYCTPAASAAASARFCKLRLWVNQFPTSSERAR